MTSAAVVLKKSPFSQSVRKKGGTSGDVFIVIVKENY